MKKTRTRLIVLAAEVALIAVLHLVLIRWHADRDTVSRIFAAGGHVPRTVLASAGFFLLVRLVAVWCLPAIILERLARILLSHTGMARTSQGSEITDP